MAIIVVLMLADLMSIVWHMLLHCSVYIVNRCRACV